MLPAAEAVNKEERRRLQAKLATGQVAGIWLQMGSDLDKLRAGLQFLRQQLEESGCAQLPVYGSVFLPTKQYAPVTSSSCLSIP